MSRKFFPLEKYTSKPSTYKLLPFRFERLHNCRVVATNAVGEFLILSHEKLEQFINHQLEPTDRDYKRLHARHFLLEENEKASLAFLSLKTRTKIRNLSDFTGLHIFVVSLRCDHSCHYCQVSRQSENKIAYDMTKATADKALDMVFRSPNPAIKIEFQGGEPLLNFELIKYVVLQAEEKNKEEKRNLQFVIATTLTLATDEMLEFCRDHAIYLSTSLDGPEDLHNHNRPRPSKDSHAKFLEGLKRARNIVGYEFVSALMTTSHASLGRVQDIIDEYLKFGFDGIFLRALSPYGFAVKTKSYEACKVDEWLDFYRQGMDYIIELNKKGFNFAEQYSTIVLTKILSSEDPGFVDLMNPAGGGIAAMAFNYDGDVYPSDESRMLKEMDDTSFRIGNVHSSSYEEIITSDVLLNAIEDSFTLSAPMCSDCAFEPWCGADPVFHHTVYGDVLGRKAESEFCKRMMGIFKYLLETMEKDKEAKAIFLRWVNKC